MAETALAADEDLMAALEPTLDGVTPRVFIELLVAADYSALWRLRGRTMPAYEFEEAWHLMGCTAEPGEWRIGLVAQMLRGIALGNVERRPEVLRNLAWFLELAADELAVWTHLAA
ncbi:MAG TPA: hypothetical protein VII76_05625 [Acidimicrobiales bacterium]